VVETTAFVWDGPVLIEQTRRGEGSSSTTWEHLGWTPISQFEQGDLVGADHGSAGSWWRERVDAAFYGIVTYLVGAPTERRTEVWQLLDPGRDVAPAGERASFEITEGDGSVRLAGAVRFEPGELARPLETMILADAVVMLLPWDVAAPTAEGWATTLLSGDGSTPGRSRAARLGRWVTETGARDVPLLAVHGAFDDPVLGVEIFTRSPGSFATDPPT
jgi:hypothetical protein